MNKNNPQAGGTNGFPKRLFFLSCAYYTGFSFLFLLIAAVSSSAIPSLRFLWMLPMSVALALGQFVLENRTLKNGLRVVYHSLICVFSVFVFLWIPYAIGREFIQFVFALVLLFALYWLTAGIALFIASSKRKELKKN